MLNYLLHTLSCCLGLYFQCDISHSCDTSLSKWKAPDLEKMFSWQRMRSVVSASNPGRSSSANQFCLNWRHPLRFVVSSLCCVSLRQHWPAPEPTLCFCINIGRVMQVKGCFTAVSLLLLQTCRALIMQTCQCSSCFVFGASKELPSCFLLIPQDINN